MNKKLPFGFYDSSFGMTAKIDNIFVQFYIDGEASGTGEIIGNNKMRRWSSVGVAFDTDLKIGRNTDGKYYFILGTASYVQR